MLGEILMDTEGSDPTTILQLRADRTAYGSITTKLKTSSGGSSATDNFIIDFEGIDSLTITSGGTATFVDTVSATNFITTSDRRLKSNITPIKDSLETLKKIVSYEYIKDEKQDAGFIAQEVKEAIPYSVFENSEGYLTMNSNPILAHMHKAIMELDKRISSIEEELR